MNGTGQQWKWGATMSGTGALMCALACMAPAVGLTAGVGGVVSATWMEGAGVGLALAGAVLVAWAVFRRRRASAGCGCSDSVVHRFPGEGPVLCTLNESNRRSRVEAFAAFFERGLKSSERGPDGEVVWRFDPAAVSMEEARELAEEEHRCCPFLDFELESRDGELVWRIRAPDDASSVLDMLHGLPAATRPGEVQPFREVSLG